MNSWPICNEILHHNEKRELMLNTGIDGYELPATLVCGAAAGKTVLVTAGIHAGEYPGVAAVMRFAKALCPDQVSGNVIFLSNVNTSGFWAKTRGYFPVDDFNLNKDYPGAPDGSAGQRLADFFVTKIFPHVDFIIDLHSGGQNEPLEPCLFFPAVAGEAVRKASEAAARATTLPHLIASTARTGEYSYAAQMGIPGLLLERGSCGLCKPEWVDAYEQDLSRLFHHLGLLESSSVSAPTRQTVYERTVYLSADRQGIWFPAIEQGQLVQKGQLLGILKDYFDRPLAEYYCEEDGIVFYYTAALAVTKGDPLVAYGLKQFSHP